MSHFVTQLARVCALNRVPFYLFIHARKRRIYTKSWTALLSANVPGSDYTAEIKTAKQQNERDEFITLSKVSLGLSYDDDDDYDDASENRLTDQ